MVMTPPTSPTSPFVADSSIVKRDIGALRGQDKTAERISKKRIHQQGVTGSHVAGPFYDGTSKVSADHLIDLDTDSMESAPDVRSYFWLVGSHVRRQREVPHDMETRVMFDAELVRAGREWLRDFRDKGYGWFLSADRDIASKNDPGSEWYRMPTTGICHDIVNGHSEAHQSECAFVDSEPTQAYEGPNTVQVPVSFWQNSTIYKDPADGKTNLRVPLLWAESFKEGVRPGTKGWDEAIKHAYSDSIHPGYVTSQLWERDEMIVNLVQLHSAKLDHDGLSVDRHKAEMVLRRDWPGLIEPHRRCQDENIGPGYLAQQGMTIDQFFGRSK